MQGQLLGEYVLVSGQLVAQMEYLWLGELPIAAVRPTANGGHEVFYLHCDHLGAPRVALDTLGRVRWRWISEPFGTAAAETNPSALGDVNISLRLPGQQYDGFVGLHYNVYRDYDPGVGRYVQSDPIGLSGGINTYGYADGSPTSKNDPLGLATYQCTRKLNNVPFRVGPLYHQYVCIGNAEDGYTCKGLGPTGSMFNSPGKLEHDAYTPEACEKVDDDNQCIEQCISKAFSSSIPNYSVDLSHGENCQTYARSVVGVCEASCRARPK